MPTNIGNAPLDGLKIGQAAIPKAYVGIDQIFPNTTEITAAAFDNASTQASRASSAGNRRRSYRKYE